MSSLGGSDAAVDVVVLDSQTVWREGLVALLGRHTPFRVAGQLERVSDLETLVSEPRVVVTSLDLPDGRGPGVVDAIGRRAPAASILVLSGVGHPSIVAQALAAGATGYVLTSASVDELVRALDSVARKETYLQPELAEALERWNGPPDAGPAIALRHLSTKETDVLRLLALGHTNAEIAALSGVSLRTVETHRARIFQKLGVQTRAQLVRYAFDEGLITTH